MARDRSPNYPAISLAVAVAAIKAFYEKERRTAVPGEVAAKAIGYAGMSGPARVKLASLKKYGLLEGNERTGLRISELGMHILFPTSGDEEDEARRKAALEPELFRSLFENYAEASDDALKSYLITRLKFAPVGAKQVIAAFRDTLSFANLKKDGYNASDMPTKSEASTPTGRDISPFFSVSSPAKPTSAKVYSWPLSKDVTAEVRFSGGDVTPDQIDRLTKYLELAKSALESDTTD